MHLGLVVVAAIVAVIVGRNVYRAFLGREVRVHRAIRRRPRVLIGEAQDDLVRVDGSVRTGPETLSAPVTRRPCAAFQVAVQVLTRSGWKTVFELADARPFFVADETGEAVINTSAGPFSLALFPDRRGSTGLHHASDDNLLTVRALLESANIPTTNLSDVPTVFRYQEAILAPGERVSVAGSGVHEVATDGERATPRSPPERYILRGTAARPLLISTWRSPSDA